MAASVQRLVLLKNVLPRHNSVTSPVLQTACMNPSNKLPVRSLAYFRGPISYDYKNARPIKQQRIQIKKPRNPPKESSVFTLQRAEQLLNSSEQMQELVTKAALDDKPMTDLPNPYASPPTKCLLCQHDVELDYKNVRLLSQYVSPYTGQIYGRRITGLCVYMQRRVTRLIKRAQFFGLMPYTMKTPEYITDPKL